MILPQLGQSGALGAYSSERSRRMNKAVLEPRYPNNVGSLLEPAWDIGDSHHVLYHHRANVIAPGSSANDASAARVREQKPSEKWERVPGPLPSNN
jgi:hypothetical protein